MADFVFKNKKILVVGSGVRRKKEEIFNTLFSLGLEIILVDNKTSWAMEYSKYLIDADPIALITANIVEEFFNKNPNLFPDAVITYDDYSTLLTSKIVDKLDLVGISYQTAEILKNKFLFREFSKAHKIPYPKYYLIGTKNYLKDLNNLHILYPAIVKPFDGAGSAFVKYVANKSELAQILDLAFKNGYSHMLIEQYLKGSEVDLDILVQNGEIRFFSVSDNFQANGHYFVEQGGQIPSQLTLRKHLDLFKLAKNTIQALNIKNACLHYEAICTANGAFPVEVNMRVGGAETRTFQKVTWNRDLVLDALKISLNIPVQKSAILGQPRKYAASINFNPGKSGILKQLLIKKDIFAESCFEDFKLYFDIGSEIQIPPKSYSALGYLVASGDSLLSARRNLQSLARQVEFQIN